MDTVEIIIHASGFSDAVKDSLHEYVEKNLSGKLDNYIKKHDELDAPLRVELTVKKEKGDKYSGKITLQV
jgi:ribosome-associated translation inhibitor RaiA